MRAIARCSLSKKLSCRRQTARRICANTMAWLTSWKYMCYHAEFGRSALKDVGIDTGELPKILDHRNSTLLTWKARLTPRYTPIRDLCYYVKFGSSATKGGMHKKKELQNCGALGPRPLRWGVADPAETSPLPRLCYHVKLGSSATKGVRKNKKETPKLGSTETPPSWSGGVADHLKTSPLPICVTMWNLLVMRQRVYA